METPKKKSTEKFVKDILQNTRRIFTAEQKILIVMEGLRVERYQFLLQFYQQAQPV